MPRRRLTSGTRTVARQRQPTSWARFVSASKVTVPAASKLILTTTVLSNPGIGETVRRTRGRLWVESDQSAVRENQLGALGVMVVSDLAVAAGAASIPGPVTDGSDDGWFLWVPIVMGGANSDQDSAAGLGFDFDSKAMRRVEEGFTIVWMLENIHATQGYKASIGISILTSLS